MDGRLIFLLNISPFPGAEGGDIAEAVVGAEAQEGTDPAHSPVPGRRLARQGSNRCYFN